MRLYYSTITYKRKNQCPAEVPSARWCSYVVGLSLPSETIPRRVHTPRPVRNAGPGL